MGKKCWCSAQSKTSIEGEETLTEDESYENINLMEEVDRVLTVLADFLDAVEAAALKAKRKIAEMKGVEEKKNGKKRIYAEVSVDPSDPAIRWLARKLELVKAKHPTVSYSFFGGSRGWEGLEYTAPEPEAEEDILQLAKWAFRAAARGRC